MGSGCVLLMRFGTAFFTGRRAERRRLPAQASSDPADDEEAARSLVGGIEAAKGDLRHVARPGLSPVAPPVAFSVKEVHGQVPACYGRQNKVNDISFTSAAFVSWRLSIFKGYRPVPPTPGKKESWIW
eukprot:Skav212125  [mRNA]  locus=scaffold386:555308:563600:+ [translate_table: standard]